MTWQERKWRSWAREDGRHYSAGVAEERLAFAKGNPRHRGA